MLTSAQSNELDCDRKRLSKSAFSTDCMCTVKPRSLDACSAICGMAVTGGPMWFTTTSLTFCAQMVGKPPITSDPAARPAAAPTLRSRLRRDIPLMFQPPHYAASQHEHGLGTSATEKMYMMIRNACC